MSFKSKSKSSPPKEIDASGAPDPETLFHLVPANDPSYQALYFEENRPFLSESRLRGSDGKSRDGLEIGFHVPQTAQAHIITQLGRNADITLPDKERNVSRIHAAFELDPHTYRIFLRDRSGQSSSVMHWRVPAHRVPAEDELIQYGQNYRLEIGRYTFDLVWYILDETRAREIAKEGYRRSREEADLQAPCDRPTEYVEPGTLRRYPPRVKIKNSLDLGYIEVPEECKPLGHGRSGRVRLSKFVFQGGHHQICLAIKGISSAGDPENPLALEALVASRALIRNEAKMMEGLEHAYKQKHIIEIVFYHDLDDMPELAMPQRNTLIELTEHSFASGPPEACDWDSTCSKVAEHMLSALAYLATKNIVHRDVKPDNILFRFDEKVESHGLGGSLRRDYLFQLADFGLATYATKTPTSRCGTAYYQAPELYLEAPHDKVIHSHRSDIYSLCVTLVATREGLQTFRSFVAPPSYLNIFHFVQTKIRGAPLLEAMGRVTPYERPSAADLLEEYFTPRDIEMEDAEPLPCLPPPEPQPQAIPFARDNICSPTRISQGNAGRAGAGRNAAPAKLIHVHQPLRARTARRSGRATPSYRVSRRATRCSTPLVSGPVMEAKMAQALSVPKIDEPRDSAMLS